MAKIRVKRRHLFQMPPEHQRKAVVNGSNSDPPHAQSRELMLSQRPVSVEHGPGSGPAR